MSLSNLYSTARRGLLASMAATNAAGQNIANVETPGYTRRSVELRSAPQTRGGVLIQRMPGAGGGAEVSGFDRVRNGILDNAVRQGRSQSGGGEQGAFLISALEGELAPGGGSGLLGAVEDVFSAWSSVADAPTDLGTRDALIASSGRLTQTLRGTATRLAAFEGTATAELRGGVDRANELLAEVADLNVSIRTARSQGADDLDGLDRRDLLLDELSGLAPFKLSPQADGTVTVSLNGMMAVHGEDALPLRLALPPDAAAPSLLATGSDTPVTLDETGGSLGATLHVLGSVLPGARSALDTLAADIVGKVNAAHAAGTGLDGSTGQPFFDPAGTAAATIALDPGLTAESIAAGSGGPGDGSVATRVAGLGAEVGTAATRVLANVGAEARRASSSATASAALVAHAEALRDGVSSVSLDEEMANLIQFQQAYAASARVLQTATTLFDTLLAL